MNGEQMTTDDTSIRLTRSLSASPARVWRAFTDQEELQAWFWPERFETAVKVDLSVGGSYQIAAGTGAMAVGGRYIELQPPHRLTMTWQWDGDPASSQVVITLDGDAETTMTLLHDGLDAESVPPHVQGWTDCLERLPGHLDEAQPDSAR